MVQTAESIRPENLSLTLSMYVIRKQQSTGAAPSGQSSYHWPLSRQVVQSRPSTVDKIWVGSAENSCNQYLLMLSENQISDRHHAICMTFNTCTHPQTPTSRAFSFRQSISGISSHPLSLPWPAYLALRPLLLTCT